MNHWTHRATPGLHFGPREFDADDVRELASYAQELMPEHSVVVYGGGRETTAVEDLSAWDRDRLEIVVYRLAAGHHRLLTVDLTGRTMSGMELESQMSGEREDIERALAALLARVNRLGRPIFRWQDWRDIPWKAASAGLLLLWVWWAVAHSADMLTWVLGSALTLIAAAPLYRRGRTRGIAGRGRVLGYSRRTLAENRAEAKTNVRVAMWTTAATTLVAVVLWLLDVVPSR